MPVESVLRCAILKQYRQLSYEELAFCLRDSAACQAFVRLPMSCVPKKAALQETISVIDDVAWERINLALLDGARQVRVENAQMLRIDSTVTDSPIHEPLDAQRNGPTRFSLVRD